MIDEGFGEYQWIVIVAFVVAFLLAISVGANDVANPFGTSVGSGALTLLQCFVLATLMETLGALTMGGAVSDTIRKKIVNIESYNETDTSDIKKFLVGQLSAMFGAAVWQIIASVLKMPVSGTHSIVGAVVGFAIISKGVSAVQWMTIAKIVISWFASPVLSGVLAIALYTLVSKSILQAENRVSRACTFLPIFYSAVVGFNCYSITRTMNKIFKWSGSCSSGDEAEVSEANTELSGSSFCFQEWHFITIAFVVMALVYVVIRMLYIPRILRKIGALSKNICPSPTPFQKMVAKLEKKLGLTLESDIKEDVVEPEKIFLEEKNFINPENDAKMDGSETPEMQICFKELQAFSACFDAYAHGGNDVGNSIGPVMAVWAVIQTCTTLAGCNIEQTEPPQLWIILFGCSGIVLGLWTLGKRVIQTVGKDIASITPARGFSIDIMAGFTVLFGSMLQIPLSTTHCKVGAVVAVSLVHDRANVSCATFKKIAMAWFVTLPVSGVISALSYHLICLWVL